MGTRSLLIVSRRTNLYLQTISHRWRPTALSSAATRSIFASTAPRRRGSEQSCSTLKPSMSPLPMRSNLTTSYMVGTQMCPAIPQLSAESRAQLRLVELQSLFDILLDSLDFSAPLAGPGFQFARNAEGRVVINSILAGGSADCDGTIHIGDARGAGAGAGAAGRDLWAGAGARARAGGFLNDWSQEMRSSLWTESIARI